MINAVKSYDYVAQDPGPNTLRLPPKRESLILNQSGVRAALYTLVQNGKVSRTGQYTDIVSSKRLPSVVLSKATSVPLIFRDNIAPPGCQHFRF